MNVIEALASRPRHLPPTLITIRRDDRQRRELGDISDLKLSIATIGQINPVIVRERDGKIDLAAGERRTQACLELDRDVEVKWWDELSDIEIAEIEYEENAKREDLPWRDSVRATGKMHDLYVIRDPAWNQSRTAERLSLTPQWLGDLLVIYKNLDSPILADASSARHALSILERAAERRTASIVDDITRSMITAMAPAISPIQSPTSESSSGTVVLDDLGGDLSAIPVGGSAPSPSTGTPSMAPAQLADAILNVDFLQWAPTYSGPKFNLIHCDFPYGVNYEAFAHSVAQRGELYESTSDVYWALIDCFVDNIDRFCSYQAHIIFWFHMNHYEQTRKRLSAADLTIHTRPLIWHKTDNSGIVPGQGGQYPRWIYETALLCNRGKRPLVKASGDCYGGPTPNNPIHPTVKSEPMLQHFLGMMIDETTDVFDPTAGSGAAIRAAESLGARNVLGLEINPEFCTAANATIRQARAMRRISGR